METIYQYSFSRIEIGLLIILGISFIIKLSFRIFYLKSIKKSLNNKPDKNHLPVSLIICAKNQAKYLAQNLPKFLEQNYPLFEIVVVDDGSTDDTESVLLHLKKKYDHLRSTKIPLDDKFKHNKKLALSIGIKSAQYDQLLFTDPNCYPKSKDWMMNSMENAVGKTYSAYSNFTIQKGFLPNFIRYDSLMRNLKIASFTNCNKCFAGNGRNMGFEKGKFFENKAFTGHSQFESGYDHLLSHRLSKITSAVYALQPEIKLYCQSQSMKQEWKSDLRNYYTSRKYIPRKIRFLLDLEPNAQIVFIASLIAILTFTNLYPIALIVFLLEVILSGYCSKIIFTDLREANLFLSSYVYAVIRPITKLSFYTRCLIFSKRT